MSSAARTSTAPTSAGPTNAGPGTVRCPECGRPATVLDRFSLAGTAGWACYLRLRCTGPLSFLVAADAATGFPPAAASSPAASRTG